LNTAFDMAAGLIPEIASEKEEILQFIKSILPVVAEIPGAVQKLTPILKQVFHAVVKGGTVSDADAVKWKDEIIKQAGPLLKQLGEMGEKTLPYMKKLAAGNVDDLMGKLTIIPDGEIKDMVKQGLTLGNGLLKSAVQIMS